MCHLRPIFFALISHKSLWLSHMYRRRGLCVIAFRSVSSLCSFFIRSQFILCSCNGFICGRKYFEGELGYFIIIISLCCGKKDIEIFCKKISIKIRLSRNSLHSEMVHFLKYLVFRTKIRYHKSLRNVCSWYMSQCTRKRTSCSCCNTSNNPIKMCFS